MYVYIDIYRDLFHIPQGFIQSLEIYKGIYKEVFKNMMVLSSVFDLLPIFLETGSHTCFLG